MFIMVKSIISCAMSALRTRDSASERFSLDDEEALCRELQAVVLCAKLCAVGCDV